MRLSLLAGTQLEPEDISVSVYLRDTPLLDLMDTDPGANSTVALVKPPTPTFNRRGFEAPADGFSVPICLLDLDHSLSAPQLHEGAQLLHGAPELAPMA